jgi:hypothetical protein
MFTLMNKWFGQPRQARPAAAGRPRSVRLEAEQLEDRQVPSVTMTTLADGSMEVFALRAGDSQVVAEKISASGVSSGFTPTGMGAARALTVVKDGSGNPVLYAIGMDAPNTAGGTVWMQRFNADGSAVSGSVLPLSCEMVRAISAISWQDNNGFHGELFAIGMDAPSSPWGAVYGKCFYSNGIPQTCSFFPVTSQMVKAISATPAAINNSSPLSTTRSPEVFGIGTNDEVYAMFLYGGGRGGSFNSAPVQTDTVTAISASSDASGRPELLVVKQSNGQVYQQGFQANGTTVSGVYTPTSATQQVTSVCLGKDANNNFVDFATLLADSQVYEQKADSTGTLGAFTLTTAGAVR